MAGGKRGGQGGRGAKPGSHRKGAAQGSGGQRRSRLSGRGPTPPAESRPGHPAARRAAADGRAAPGNRRTPSRSAGKPPPKEGRRGGAGDVPEVVVGRNAVVEVLRAGAPANTLYVAERAEADDRLREAVRLASDRGLALLELPRPELDRLTGAAVHQGLALQVPAYDYIEPADLVTRAMDRAEVPLVVALDGVTDPRNLGAVIRSVAAFGGTGVLIPQRRSAGVTAAVWKASAGALARVPVARAGNLTRALKDYQAAGMFVVGLAADGEVDVDALEVGADPLVLVVGGEGRGLSRLVGQTCDLRARIPIGTRAESLNAGVAAGIALYEVARLRLGR